MVFHDELPASARQERFAGSAFVYGDPPVHWLEKPRELGVQWIQLNSAGFESYQHLKLDLPVSNMHGFFAQPCAETVVAGLMALYRKIHRFVLLKENRDWQQKELRNQVRLLRDKKVIILGTGTIAMAIREILEGFRCRIAFFGRSHPEATLKEKKALIRQLPQTDILINTLPGTDETEEFVNASMLNALGAGAVFANIGRGSTVDEKILIRLLQERQIGGAVLDVHQEEPLPPDHPLWSCPNTILTQHTGGGTVEEEENKIRVFLENLDRVLKGETPLHLVNLQKGY